MPGFIDFFRQQIENEQGIPDEQLDAAIAAEGLPQPRPDLQQQQNVALDNPGGVNGFNMSVVQALESIGGFFGGGVLNARFYNGVPPQNLQVTLLSEDVEKIAQRVIVLLEEREAE